VGTQIGVIGNPIANVKAIVLDGKLQSVPVGAVGELLLGGPGVARGYLNRPDLTPERFVSRNGARWFRTGDLARQRVDGSFQLIGRADRQVKVRGFRVELGEVEAALSEHPMVQQVVAVVVRGALTACCKIDVDDAVLDSRSKVQEFLGSRLPQYMIPSRVVFFRQENFPRNTSGKVDVKMVVRRLDQQIEESFAFNNRKDYKLTSEEEQIADVWRKVLGTPGQTFCSDDDFFFVGGDSILAIRVAQGLGCRAGDVLRYRTLETLAACVFSSSNKSKDFLAAEQGELAGSFGLLPVQKWFFDLNLRTPEHWNQAFCVKTPPLDLPLLVRLRDGLAARHDMLRARFVTDGSRKWLQEYISLEKYDMPEVCMLDFGCDGGLEVLSRAQQSFNLQQGPLWCMIYVHGYPDGSSRVFFAFHHLIMDAVSWRIIASDMRAIYEGEQLQDRRKTNSYRQWVEILGEYKHAYWTEAHEKWKHAQEQDIGGISFVKPFAKSFALSRQETRRLLHVANLAYKTSTEEILLCGLTSALSRCSLGSWVTLEGYGRGGSVADNVDLSQTVGWFTCMYPLGLPVGAEEWKGITREVQLIFREVPDKGLGFGVCCGLDPEKLPRISFNYLGQFGDGLDHEFWQVTEDEVGEECASDTYDPFWVSVDCWCVGEVFKCSVKSQLDYEITSTFIEVLEKQIKDLVHHCCLLDPKVVIRIISGASDALKDSSNDAAPLFLVHPAGGFLYCYRGFQRVTDRAVYGIAFPEEASFQDMDMMAQDYVMRVRARLGEANNFRCRLGGWSFGGGVCLKMAILLANEGIEVEMVYLFDPVIFGDCPVDTADDDYRREPENFIVTQNMERMEQLRRSAVAPSAPYLGRVVLFKALRHIAYASFPKNKYDAFCKNLLVVNLDMDHYMFEEETIERTMTEFSKLDV
jgi:non-ribosomal peptide synthase protein (TIGR01720 family)